LDAKKKNAIVLRSERKTINQNPQTFLRRKRKQSFSSQSKPEERGRVRDVLLVERRDIIQKIVPINQKKLQK
jgi:hypothetical protein